MARDAVADGGWIELSHGIHEDTARMPFLPAPEVESLPEGYNRASKFTLATHAGTHIEAPDHVLEDGKTIDEYPADRWLTEGVVCEVDADPNEAIRLDQVEPLAGELSAGEALVIQSGWDDLVGGDAYFEYPYFALELAEWIVEREPSWVGIDFPSPEDASRIDEDAYDYPVHTTLLENDIPIAENMTNLSELAGRRVELVALPLNLRGVEAAPARIVARPL